MLKRLTHQQYQQNLLILKNLKFLKTYSIQIGHLYLCYQKNPKFLKNLKPLI